MRAFTLVLFVLFSGCGRTTLQTVETINSPTGNDRLIRKAWESTSFSSPGEHSYDAHSLVWQRLNDGVWTDYISITQDAFQRGSLHRRWISAIHSFNPKSGTAVLKIVEGNAPEDSATVSYIYSWREWDLNANTEIKTIRVCKDPFEPFEI